MLKFANRHSELIKFANRHSERLSMKRMLILCVSIGCVMKVLFVFDLMNHIDCSVHQKFTVDTHTGTSADMTVSRLTRRRSKDH